MNRDDGSPVHAGLGRDVAVGGSAWTAIVVPVALAGLPTSTVVATGLLTASLILIGVGARHLRRLARRLRLARAREQALAHRATHDPLTGLANRTLLLERLQLDLRRLGRTGGTVLVAYLDVDDLKVVNDAFGHAAGDRLLRAAAERLRAAVRNVDTVARIGGDEFVVTCAVDDPEVAHQLVERLVMAAVPSLRPDGGVGLSLGWVLADGPSEDALALVARADAAMFRDKARRRGERGGVWLPALVDRRPARHAPCGCPIGYGSHLAGCHAADQPLEVLTGS